MPQVRLVKLTAVSILTLFFSKGAVKTMKNMKKILALSLVCCMCAGALVGCNKDSGSSSTTSGSSTEKKADNGDSGEAANAKDNTGDTVEVKGDASKGKVYWLNFKPEEAFDKTIKELAKTYKDKTGTEVKIVTAASGTYEQTLSGEMDKSEAPTMFVIGNAAGAKKWGEFALDLNNTKIGKERNTQTYNIHDADGKLVSIPYCYEAYGLIVNCDLLDKAGHIRSTRSRISLPSRLLLRISIRIRISSALMHLLHAIWMTLHPGVSQAIWSTSSISMRKRNQAASGQNVPQASPAIMFRTIRTCLISASTTASPILRNSQQADTTHHSSSRIRRLHSQYRAHGNMQAMQTLVSRT